MKSQSTSYRLITDGGSRGNPGPAYGSYKVLSLESPTAVLVRLDLGRATSNEAEYQTAVTAVRNLVAGVERAGIDPATRTVELVTDSKLIRGQVAQGWKVNAQHLRPYVDELRYHLELFGEWTITWVSRYEIVPVLGH